MTISTRKIKTIAKGRGNSMSYARWSPNGKYVCFTEAQRDKEPMTNASFDQLFVIKADGSSRQRLTNHWGNDYSPQWTRDGKFIVIQGERGMTAAAQGSIGDTSSSVIVVSAFGKGERILCPGVYGYLPALSP